MHLRSLLLQFLRDVRSQKLRTFLTVFGIVWGTAAVTLLLAFGQGLEEQIIKSQKGLGDNIVICWPSRTSKPWAGNPKGRRIRVTEADIAMLHHDIPEIKAISGEFQDQKLGFKVGHKTLVPQISATSPVFAVMRNIIPQAGGRYFDRLDMEQRRRVVFLGDALKKDLFGDQQAVGHFISIGTVPFLVVGVMEKKAQDSAYSGRDKDKAFIPLTTFEASHNQRNVNDFIFQATSAAATKETKQKVLTVLAHRYHFDPSDTQAVLMWDTTEGMKFLNVFFLVFRTFLGLMGFLTLVVGGIGVSNIMHVVVEERAKEIGLKMALGARRRYVIFQFLFETLLIMVLGAIVGFAIAWGICAVFPLLKLGEYVGNPQISAQVASITALILGVIGLLAGYFPARSASRLNPVEALRL